MGRPGVSDGSAGPGAWPASSADPAGGLWAGTKVGRLPGEEDCEDADFYRPKAAAWHAGRGDGAAAAPRPPAGPAGRPPKKAHHHHQPALVLVTTVDIGGGASATLTVADGEDTGAAAAAFCAAHGLPAAVAAPLASHLDENLAGARAARAAEAAGGTIPASRDVPVSPVAAPTPDGATTARARGGGLFSRRTKERSPSPASPPRRRSLGQALRQLSARKAAPVAVEVAPQPPSPRPPAATGAEQAEASATAAAAAARTRTHHDPPPPPIEIAPTEWNAAAAEVEAGAAFEEVGAPGSSPPPAAESEEEGDAPDAAPTMTAASTPARPHNPPSSVPSPSFMSPGSARIMAQRPQTHATPAERMYEEGRAAAAAREAAAVAARAAAAAAEVAGATFSPTLVARPAAASRRPGPAWARLGVSEPSRRKAAAAARAAEQAAEAAAAELAECTFAPSICPGSAALVAGRRSTGAARQAAAVPAATPVTDALYADAAARRARQAEREAAERAAIAAAAKGPTPLRRRPGKPGAAAATPGAAPALPAHERLLTQATARAAARAAAAAPAVDPTTGRRLFQPAKAGGGAAPAHVRAALERRKAAAAAAARGASGEASSSKPSVGDYLYVQALAARRRAADAAAAADAEAAAAASAVAPHPSSAALMGRLRARRFGQVFAYLARGRAGAGTPSGLDIRAAVADADLMDALDDEVAADVWAAADVLCGGSRRAGGGGGGGGGASSASPPSTSVPVLVSQAGFVRAMEAVLKRGGPPRAYLLPSAGRSGCAGGHGHSGCHARCVADEWAKGAGGEGGGPAASRVLPTSQALAARARRPAGLPAVDALARDAAAAAARKEAARAAAAQAEMAECTFAPKLVSRPPPKRSAAEVEATAAARAARRAADAAADAARRAAAEDGDDEDPWLALGGGPHGGGRGGDAHRGHHHVPGALSASDDEDRQAAASPPGSPGLARHAALDRELRALLLADRVDAGFYFEGEEEEEDGEGGGDDEDGARPSTEAMLVAAAAERAGGVEGAPGPPSPVQACTGDDDESYAGAYARAHGGGHAGAVSVSALPPAMADALRELRASGGGGELCEG